MAKVPVAVLALAAMLMFWHGDLVPPALAGTAADTVRLAQATTEIHLVGARPPGPGEQALPKTGERLVVDIPPGAIVKFVDSTFGPADVQVNPTGDDLEMAFNDGGVLVLRGFLAEPPEGMDFATMELADGTVIPALAFQEMAAPTEAAAGASAGGGEVFGLVRVVWWLLDRVDLVGRAEAAEAKADEADGTASVTVAPSSAEDRILDQVLAQMMIARDGDIAAAAADYHERTVALQAEIKQRADGGGAGHVDVMLAESVNLNAELEQAEADFAFTLAIDAHQDRFGERLETAAYRPWPSPPPADLAAVSDQVGSDRRAAARRHWRLMNFANKTLPMLERLQTMALDVREGYIQQFEVGQRSLTELQSAEEVVYRVRVRLAQRTYDLKTAEAWLLAVTGQLPASVILRPGWQ